MNGLRGIVALVLLLAFVALGIAALRTPRETVSPPLAIRSPTTLAGPAVPASSPPPADRPTPEDCAAAVGFTAAATDNANSLASLAVSPFNLPEFGWAAYAPLVAREIATACAPETAGFALHLAAWQSAQRLKGDGRMDAPTLSRMAVIWLQRRPFVALAQKACPTFPDEATLAQTAPAEAYGGKKILARAGALAAFRRMDEVARNELGADTPPLKIASAYRGPIEEALKCALGGCGTPGKARCSAHRTGLAFDFYFGVGTGPNAFSTDPANRLALSRSPAYRWLVTNADRFGFVNYPYEPWHWEWTGETV